MTVEAERKFLRITLGRKTLVPGQTFDYVQQEHLGGLTWKPVGVRIDIVSPDLVRITEDSSEIFAYLLSPDRRDFAMETKTSLHNRRKIDGISIPTKIPGVKTTLKWIPTNR